MRRRSARMPGSRVAPSIAVVPGPVAVGAVAVALAVVLVVLDVVGDEVGEGEAVVGGDEVDRRDRPAVPAPEQVAGAGTAGSRPRGRRGCRIRSTWARRSWTQKARIESRNRSFHSLKGGGNWPVRQPWIPTSQGSAMSLTWDSTGSVRRAMRNGWSGSKSSPRPRLRATARSKRNPSTWNSVDPVAQRVHRHPRDDRVAQVEGVAAAGDVDVLPALVEAVVGAVVEPAERQRRAGAVGLGRVVEDDVEDDLDPRLRGAA